MTFSTDLRKLVLTAHVTSSVGWLGAVVSFLALTVVGLTSLEPQMVRAVYLAAEPLTQFVIVPLALTSLLSGIVQSLGTPWGLVRHYWVIFKLLFTVVATLILLQYTQTVTYFAALAIKPDPLPVVGLHSYLLHSGAGLVVLIVTTTLSVYKPRGMTRYGKRKQQEERQL